LPLYAAFKGFVQNCTQLTVHTVILQESVSSLSILGAIVAI